MGNNETTTPSRSQKSSSPVQLQEQPAVHPYPDWAAMQAYYGPGVMPPPYFSTSVGPGYVPPPYMWAHRPLIPPFGSPYAVMYPHGVYPHSSLPLGAHAHYPGFLPSPAATEEVVMAAPLSVEMPDKPSTSNDKGLITKLKGFDGLVTVGNRSTNSTAGTYGNDLPQSGYNSADGSTNGSDGSNPARGSDNQRKLGSEDVPSSDDRKFDTNADPAHCGERSSSSKTSSGDTVAPTNIAGNQANNVPSPCQAQALVVKTIGTPVPLPKVPMVPGCNGVPSELWMQDERALKRERRKQSNRESARRSRLRKQAENEELDKKVKTLSAENTNLKSEICRLTKSSDTLRLENSALLEKFKNAQSNGTKEPSLDKIEIEGSPSVVVENFLSMIDKPSAIAPSEKQEDESNDKSSSKLRRLLDTNPRTDVVAAS